MTKFTALVIIVTLRIFYQPAVKDSAAPFASPRHIETVKTGFLASFINVEAVRKNDRVFINWTVKENETADMFEVERSSDGSNFSMAALVFGTDLPATGSYQFYEKPGNQKLFYRIRLIDKNKLSTYSEVVEMNPITKKSNG